MVCVGTERFDRSLRPSTRYAASRATITRP